METLVCRPAPRELNLEEHQQYVAVAAKIGMADHPLMVEAALLQVLVEENIRVYDLDQVELYLDQMFRTWAWSPLREFDMFRDGVNRMNAKRSHWSGRKKKHWWSFEMTDFNNGGIGSDLYTKPVPLPVLLTIEKIQSKVPQVKFYVSNEDDRSFRDPFLMCRVPGINTRFYVIEKWDEPSFRGK